MSFLKGALSCFLLASGAVGQTPALFNGAINGVTYSTGQPFSRDSIASLFGSKIASSLAMANSVPVSTNQAETGRAVLPLFPAVVSTVPANGDVNPYGMVVVPRSLLGSTTIQPGDILVSNFNSAQGGQGTGTTIVRFDQHGQQSLFYQGKGLGFTGALGILSDGIVVAGSLPTTDGTPATIQPGSLLFIDPRGNLLMMLAQSAGIDGPWGLAIHDFGGGAGQIFVSNVLSGSVIRLDVVYNGGGQLVQVLRTVTIATNYLHRTDPDALVLGPSGLAYDPQNDTLFVANSANNTIYSIHGAGSTTSMLGDGEVVFNDLTKLHGPVNMVLGPNGHLIVSNSDGSNQDPNQTSELVELTETGQFVGEYSIDPGSGASFGIAVTTLAPGVIRLNAVDDASNTMKTFVTVIQ